MSTVKNVKTAAHRVLRFNTLAEVLAEAERLAQAETAGRLTLTGNWTLGQNFNHLASWMDYAFDGYPPGVSSPPWIIRMIMRLQKKKFMRGPLLRGIRIPGQREGTAGTEPMSTAEGLAKLRRAIARLSVQQPPKPNPLFGPLSHQEWMTLHCRHAELHLGYAQG